MAASIVTNLLNIPLNWAFMTGWGIFPEWGVRGIAFATVLSFLAGTSILFALVRFKLGVRLGGRLGGQLSFRHRAKEIREAAVPILKIGVPAALEPFSYTMQSFIVSAVLIRFGTVAMAANTYANKYIFLDMAVSWSLTAGGQILMSHHLGAGNIEQVRKTWWRIAAIASSFALPSYLSSICSGAFSCLSSPATRKYSRWRPPLSSFHCSWNRYGRSTFSVASRSRRSATAFSA
jgi:Na+-driven multidrug efflux pump